MAQSRTITFIDDLDGKEIRDSDAPTVQFSLDGTTFEIDLTDTNQAKLRKALEPYITAGRQTSSRQGTRSRRSSSSSSAVGPSAAEIRAWAQSNGHSVPDRGRIPAAVRSAFDAAN